MIAREANAMQRDRLRSVLLVLQGRQTLEVTATVGRSRAFVQRVKAGATPRDGVASLRGPPIQVILDREFGKSIWVFAAVEPATGWSLAMPFRDVNIATMQAFLDAAASKLRRREYAVMILEGAG